MKKTHTFFLTGLFLGIVSFYCFLLFFPRKPQYEMFFSEMSQILQEHQKNLPTPNRNTILNNLSHTFVASYGDRFTQYFSPEEVLSFATMIEGDFEGIGAYIEESEGGVYVSDVLPGSPAQEA